MSYIIDKVFSLAPILIFAYHSMTSISCKINLITSLKILLCYLFASLLKLIFRKKRRVRTFAFKSWVPNERFCMIKKLKGDYGFPSTHATFFCMYFLMNRDVYSCAIFLIGTFFRVYYEHHTVAQVIFGIVCSVIFEYLWVSYALTYLKSSLIGV